MRPPAPLSRGGDTEALSAGRIAGSLAAGFVAGAICLAIWLWFVRTLHFNLSFIAVGVGFVVGFVAAAVAQKDTLVVTGGAMVLAVGFAVAGVWRSLTMGGIGGAIFAVLCILLAAGAAAKAADSDPDAGD